MPDCHLFTFLSAWESLESLTWSLVRVRPVGVQQVLGVGFPPSSPSPLVPSLGPATKVYLNLDRSLLSGFLHWSLL